MNTYKNLNYNYINGTWRKGSGDKAVPVKNPYTGEELFSFQSASKSDIDEAYDAAEKAQKEWAKTTPTEKRNIFDKAVAIMQERKDEITEWVTKESGGTVTKAQIEWNIAYESLRVSANYPYEVDGKIFPSLIPGKESRMYRYPEGIITVITPWNFPMNLTMRSIAPAIATGNAVVLKPAEQTPVTGATILGKVFEEAGLPKGVLNIVLGKGSDIGDYLVKHPKTKHISFTGSTKIGKRVAKNAAESFKKTSLELGGNNVQIVLDDADIDLAVKSTLWGKFMHQGQICMAINRVLLHEDIYDEFTEKFVAATKELKIGDPTKPNTDIGPLVSSDQVEKVNKMVDKAIEQGAKLLTERKTEGNIISPIVLENVSNDMDIAQNEVFGPVASLLSFSTDEEAIELANASNMGLSGGVHSKNTERALRIAQQIETGNIHINDQTVNDDANAVFGGEKESGMGRFNGDFVKETFTTTQWVTVQHQEREYAF